MTKHEKEIIYRQLYEEKVSEWKMDINFFVLPAVSFVGLYTVILWPLVVTNDVISLFICICPAVLCRLDNGNVTIHTKLLTSLF